MYNKTILMGRIVNDLELKTTPNGRGVCSFRIAVERQFKNADGERQTDFFNIAAWGKTAEMVTRWFSKGRMILIEGELTTRQYTDKNGNNATWYEINAERVSFTGEKKDEAPAVTNTQNGEPDIAGAADTDDDYPF